MNFKQNNNSCLADSSIDGRWQVSSLRTWEAVHMFIVWRHAVLRHSCAGQNVLILERRIKIKDKNEEEYKGSEGKGRC
jgi:hypothetical protein